MLNNEILKKYNKPENFFNRDLSWVEFNRRVLEEALNPELPLLDKVKFVSIFFSNLDEFYMIRVSGLKEQIRANIIKPALDGLTPFEEVREIEKQVKKMLKVIDDLWSKTILPDLKNNNIYISKINDLTKAEQNSLTEYFHNEIYPVLTPLAFDPGRPFPYISNLSLSFAILISKNGNDKHFARVKIPSILPRLLRIDEILNQKKRKNTSSAKFIWIDDLIKHNLHFLFPGVTIEKAHQFRITRNTDLSIQEDEADDLLECIEENIKQRKFGSVVRLEVEKEMPEFMLDTLAENLEIKKSDSQIIDGPLGLSDVMELYSLPFHHLKEKLFQPRSFTALDEDENIFSLIKQKDILLHHPYDSFAPVIDFIKEASQDPDVLAIKQTLYRVGSNSPIVKYLIEAAERGKQVAVLVELKARFDEENNIFWARKLEEAGVHVIYGLVGLKTHAKMTMVVRKESEGVQRYVHLSTGNYNSSTAKLYTDLGFFTADKDIAKDVADIFNLLTGYSNQKEFSKLFVSPINTRNKFLDLIEREIQNKKNGGEGHIIFKFNSLVDTTLILALYEASKNGVKIDLIVRGICCLKPQVPGLSENIKVRSIIGRFLEHSRIYYFFNNGKEELYLSSADLMQRNLDRRVEDTFPIENENIKQTIINSILKLFLIDNVKARTLQADGKYILKKKKKDDEIISVQELFMKSNLIGLKKSIKQKTLS
ncbi:MAG: polyphosphate kinase 1 [Ignavibacteriae bacterium]|nr:polyphosphate kinase 1 [Ignavibacteriota bacterium]